MAFSNVSYLFQIDEDPDNHYIGNWKTVHRKKNRKHFGHHSSEEMKSESDPLQLHDDNIVSIF